MRGHLRCTACGATASARVIDEPDVNYCEVDDRYPIEWEDGDEHCQHDDYEISDVEPNEPQEDW